MYFRADERPVKPQAQEIPDLSIVPLALCNPDQRMELLDIRNHDSVRRNMYNDKIITKDEHLNWCKAIENSCFDHIHIVFERSSIIGCLGFRSISWNDKRSDWAFYLSKRVQGRGFGKWLERIALKHFFDSLEMQKLNCEVLEFNSLVIEMHKRFGFTLEGRRRSHVLREDVCFDAILLGMTAAEYERSISAPS